MKVSSARRKELFFQTTTSSLLFIYLFYVIALILADAIYPKLGDLWRAFRSEEMLFAIKLSIITSLVTTFISALIAIPSAYALSRFRFPLPTLIDTILDLPIVLPPLVAGISILVFFDTALGRWIEKLGIHFVHTTYGIILAQFTIAAAFAVRACKAAFDDVSPRYEDVARSLGCSRPLAFWKVTLPLAKNGIIAGIIMTWARAMGEFAPIIIVAGATPLKTEVLPIAIFMNLSIGNIEIALAATLILVFISFITLLLFKLLGGKLYLR
ncbi:ABC transporter permease [bacterium]|nr:ABC transporter permease [bacterium]